MSDPKLTFDHACWCKTFWSDWMGTWSMMKQELLILVFHVTSSPGPSLLAHSFLLCLSWQPNFASSLQQVALGFISNDSACLKSKSPNKLAMCGWITPIATKLHVSLNFNSTPWRWDSTNQNHIEWSVFWLVMLVIGWLAFVFQIPKMKKFQWSNKHSLQGWICWFHSCNFATHGLATNEFAAACSF